ncbi:hypothetical protein C0J52_23856, partial [Blattella germanica]
FYTHVEETKEGIEEEWNCIKELLQKTAKEVLGTKKPGRRRKGVKIWDLEIQKLVKDKKEAYLKYLNNKNDQNKIEYNRTRALVKRYTRTLNREHWDRYIADMEHNLHGRQDKVYKFIRSLNSTEKDKTNLQLIQDVELENHYRTLWTDNQNIEQIIDKIKTHAEVDELEMQEMTEVLKKTNANIRQLFNDSILNPVLNRTLSFRGVLEFSRELNSDQCFVRKRQITKGGNISCCNLPHNMWGQDCFVLYQEISWPMPYKDQTCLCAGDDLMQPYGHLNNKLHE